MGFQSLFLFEILLFSMETADCKVWYKIVT